MKIYRTNEALREPSLIGQKTFRVYCTDEPIETKKHAHFNV